MNTETRNCQNCKKDFTIEPDDFAFYEKIGVPPPTRCPKCRLKRRLNWHGYRILYKRTCDFTGEQMLSTYHPNSPYKVYRQDVWWSDKWDPKSYGKEIDWSRPFLEQYKELFLEVPHPSLMTAHATMVDSEYCNGASSCKNCYLCFRITKGEDSGYLNTIVDAKQCFDCSFLNHSELCYGSVNIDHCYEVFFSENCEECASIWFSRDLVGCSNCFGCVNLRQKQYCIFNEQFTKEEYWKRLDEFTTGTQEGLRELMLKARELSLAQPCKQFHGIKRVNVTGDYISNSKNVRNSYLFTNGEDLRYCQFLKDGPATSSYDWTFFGDKGELMYDTCWSGLGARNVKFCSWNYSNHDIEYCFGCHNSENLFGCLGIRKGAYCILNKQYSKEDYTITVEKIKRNMAEYPYRDTLGRECRYGEMIPVELSPWAYNESSAFEWFPITKEEAIASGFNWRDEDKREYQNANFAVSGNIENVPDEILKAILKCDNCGKNFQIIHMELQFL